MPVLTTMTVGRFIRELITGISPVSILLEEWGLTADDYLELKKTPVFRAELQKVREQVHAEGANASYVTRMQLLSEEFIGDIEKIVRDEMAPHAVKADMIKFAAEMGRLRPEKKQEGAAAGTQVTFNFAPSIGKLLGVEKILEVTPNHIENNDSNRTP